MTQVVSVDPGLAAVELDGRRVPLRGVRQCRVCQSPQRKQIEMALAQGATDLGVVRALPDGAGITARNVGEHRRRGHLAVDHAAVRDAAEVAARGLLDADAARVLFEATELTVAQVVMTRASERVASGELKPTIRDGLRAARLLLLAEKKGRVQERREVRAAVEAAMKHAVAVMNDDQNVAFRRRFFDDPATRGLANIGPWRMPRAPEGFR